MLSAIPCRVIQRLIRYPDGGDLVLACRTLVRPAHPDPDAAGAPLADDIEICERADDPFLQIANESAYVRSPAAQIEHDVDNPLSGAVISELTAAAGDVDGKAGLDQLVLLGTGASGKKRRMLEEPNELAPCPFGDGRNASVHHRERDS